MLDKLKELISGFMTTVSLGARIVIGTVLGALGSSTLIGFLAELGAVNYALAYGARLPTEGVPFLRYATTGLSLAIFLLAFGVLFLLNFFLLGAIQQFLSWHSIKPFSKDGALANMPLQKYLVLGAVPAFAATQGLTQVFFLLAPTSVVFHAA